MIRTAVALGVWLAGPAAGSDASQDPQVGSPLGLTWQAPAGCPDRAAVRDAVAGYLGEPIPASLDPAIAVDGRVSPTQDGRFDLVLTTKVGSDDGERRLRSSDCAVLARVAALVVAIAIDPSAAERNEDQTIAAGLAASSQSGDGGTQTGSGGTRVEGDEPPVDDKGAAVDDAQAKDDTPPPKPESPPETQKRKYRGGPFALRVTAAAEIGALPSIAPGIAGAVAYLWPRARIELTGAYWFPRRETLDDGANSGRGDLSLGTAGVRGCYTPGIKTVQFPICGGLEAGAMVGSGVGVRQSRTVRQLWVGATVGPAIAYVPVKALAIWLGVDLAIPFSRPSFNIDGIGATYDAGPVSGRGYLGLELRFP